MIESNNKYHEYKITDIKKINIRYYLIKIEDKSYIIDFANPRNIKTYFPLLFPLSNHQWALYDVTNSKNKYQAKSLPLYQTSAYRLTLKKIVYVYLINIMLFPEALNVHFLTKNKRIGEHWLSSLLFILFGAFIIFGVLFFQQTNISLPQMQKLLMRKKGTPSKRILGYFILIVGILSCLLIGIGGSSYSQLFVFGVLPLYSLLFNRFEGFLDIETDTYQIFEKETQ